MIKVRESAYEENDPLNDAISTASIIKASNTSINKNKANDKPCVFREIIKETDNKKRSRLVATCYCSRRFLYL
jgi:hypothetical protein